MAITKMTRAMRRYGAKAGDAVTVESRKAFASLGMEPQQTLIYIPYEGHDGDGIGWLYETGADNGNRRWSTFDSPLVDAEVIGVKRNGEEVSPLDGSLPAKIENFLFSSRFEGVWGASSSKQETLVELAEQILAFVREVYQPKAA